MNLTIDEFKKAQLTILDEFISYCFYNNLEYFAIYGTLLGAVRHSGYIPWDDDIDIGMPRDSYDSFVKTYKSEIFEIHNCESDKTYPYPFSKLSLKKTSMIEKDSSFDFGINIDIFPIDRFPDNPLKQKFLLKIISFLLRLITIQYSNKKDKSTLRFVLKKALLPLPVSFLGKLMNILSKSFSGCKFSGVICWGEKEKEIIPADVFYNSVFCKFEDRDIKIPSKYDVYLKSIYGDYMKLPPESARVNRHFFTAYIKE